MDALFPQRDFRFDLRVTPGKIADFFTSSDKADLESKLSLRRHLLWQDEFSESRMVALPEGEPLVDEAVAVLAESGLSLPQPVLEPGKHLQDRLRYVGSALEPDLLFLSRKAPQLPLHAAVVCFPSSWDLQEKAGRDIAEIHSVVPGLNDSLEERIRTFLLNAKPGIAWQRSNWGLSSSPILDQHPRLQIPAIISGTPEEKIYLRIEDQAFIALPKTEGLLFAIKLRILSLADLRKYPEACRGLAQALRSMSPQMLAYKRLDSIAPELEQRLSACA
jgi:hypothetical protein